MNRLQRDVGGLRDENNRLATLVAEKQPLVDRLHATIAALYQVGWRPGQVGVFGGGGGPLALLSIPACRSTQSTLKLNAHSPAGWEGPRRSAATSRHTLRGQLGCHTIFPKRY